MIDNAQSSDGAKELKKMFLAGGKNLIQGLGQVAIIYPLLNDFFVIASQIQSRGEFGNVLRRFQDILDTLEDDSVDPLHIVRANTKKTADHACIDLYEKFRSKLTETERVSEREQLKKTLCAYASKLKKMTEAYKNVTAEESTQLVIPNNAVAERYFSIFKHIEVIFKYLFFHFEK